MQDARSCHQPCFVDSVSVHPNTLLYHASHLSFLNHSLQILGSVHHLCPLVPLLPAGISTT
ncbi:hypothetical protein HanXRQr2_Chr09g0413021 [Helianthus annuus]|uniref:Uncharacterized protein n=1 Tax=Helianthus annuus TaxID=4232 RepID=A0A9K3IAD4_HELAN|nr:hypothetical protein HanXRQr2_Chr09g0413021 [Helianthus annuus]